jgi:hypothetical protein
MFVVVSNLHGCDVSMKSIDFCEVESFFGRVIELTLVWQVKVKSFMFLSYPYVVTKDEF